ncbi:Holliday junction resolvase RecU [bacterium]|nr:Holliday junction resolvase RecU [bacterium]
MTVNRGKKFENVIREAFEKVPDVSIDRLHDQTNGFKGSQNICDFIVYKEPYEYYFECKSVHGASLPFSNITDTQWNGLLQKSQIEGVFAGVICWWTQKDTTLFIPIQILEAERLEGKKSIRFDYENQFLGYYPSGELEIETIEIKGKKKRVFFDYDMEEFFNAISMS